MHSIYTLHLPGQVRLDQIYIHEPSIRGLLSIMAKFSAIEKNVDQRIQIIVEALAKHEIQKKLPGLQGLLHDYLAPDVDVTAEAYHRRFLAVFKSSPDTTFEECLAQLLPDQETRIKQFVDGSPLGEIARGFKNSSSQGVKEHVTLMNASDAVHVSSVAPMRVKGLGSDKLQNRDSGFHEFVTRLEELFQSLTHVDKESRDDVILSTALEQVAAEEG